MGDFELIMLISNNSPPVVADGHIFYCGCVNNLTTRANNLNLSCSLVPPCSWVAEQVSNRHGTRSILCLFI